jgi:hypothetical protein
MDPFHSSSWKRHRQDTIGWVSDGWCNRVRNWLLRPEVQEALVRYPITNNPYSIFNIQLVDKLGKAGQGA